MQNQSSASDYIKSISILGSTGSIGKQTLDVARRLNYRVTGIAANSNIELLYKQIQEFSPTAAAIFDYDAYKKFVDNNPFGIKVLYGIEGLNFIASMEDTDIVVNSVVGSVGLMPTLAAIESGHDVALANKETLVTAGGIVTKKAKEKNVKILPVDSEHSAIFQCLQGSEDKNVNKIYLTASGGPFRGKSYQDLKQVTLADALKHPNWSMGKKITIDSATMMNKGLEMIEAKWLFDLEPEQIVPIVHPQSIVHSMVEFSDGSVISQMGEADMRLPIQYALTYPSRTDTGLPKLDLLKHNCLTFESPDYNVFRCLKLATDALKIGGTMPAVLNSANEAAVALFLESKITFLDIPILIENAMNAYTVLTDYSLKDLQNADSFAREYVLKQSINKFGG